MLANNNGGSFSGILKKLKLFLFSSVELTVHNFAKGVIKLKRTKGFSWIFLMVMSFVLILPSLTVSANGKGKVYEIAINNEIEKGLVEHLKRGFDEAKSNNAEAIILNMHTPGGFVTAASDIGRISWTKSRFRSLLSSTRMHFRLGRILPYMPTKSI